MSDQSHYFSNFLLTSGPSFHMLFRIWEKKFGRSANHKKKEEETRALARTIRGHTTQITGSKTQLGQGSSATKGPGSLRQSKDKSFSQVHNPAYGSSAVVTPAGTLHPSWEAKRRLKEKIGRAHV